MRVYLYFGLMIDDDDDDDDDDENIKEKLHQLL